MACEMKKYACKVWSYEAAYVHFQGNGCPSQLCLLEESAGKIAAEFVYLYPPGIPIIVPGEQITGLFYKECEKIYGAGLNLHGLCGENERNNKRSKGAGRGVIPCLNNYGKNILHYGKKRIREGSYLCQTGCT